MHRIGCRRLQHKNCSSERCIRDRYSTIVPNAAIYTLDGQAYVRLAVREPSYWSYDYVVRTMPVTVIERGDSHTAISEKLFTSDPVILAPDTMLMDGQRILEQ